MSTPPKGARKPMDRLAAEASVQDGEDLVTANLNGVAIRILSPLDWDKAAAAAINRLDFDAWASGAVHKDDVRKFHETQATVRQTLEFIRSVEERAGADVGEYLASRSS